ncbi:hypothetical protein C8R47DRAFT_1170250 [Mycena vitilis]|nr:hypothetical protein C8R47DRAFT_1170250 [Mycena vitilis]
MVYTRIVDGEPLETDEAACAAFLRHVEELHESEPDSRYFTIPHIDLTLWQVIEQKFGERKYFKLEYDGPAECALVGWPHPLRQTFRSLVGMLEELVHSISLANHYRDPARQRSRKYYYCFWNCDVNFDGGPHVRSMRTPDFQFVHRNDERRWRRIVLDCGVGQAPHYLRDKLAMWTTHPNIELAIAIDLQAAQYTPPKAKPVEGEHQYTHEQILAMERAPLGPIVFHGHCWAERINKIIFSMHTAGRTETLDLTPALNGDVEAEVRLDNAQHRVAFLIGRAAKCIVGGTQFKESFTQENPFEMDWAEFYREIHRGQAILADMRYEAWDITRDRRDGFFGGWP